MVNGASKYSIACKDEKYTPNIIVSSKPCFACEWKASVIAWWAQVTDTPDASKITVFNKGIWNGLKGSKFVGGQIPPISTVLFKLLWKNLQKKEKKKSTSDTINKIIPQRNPCITFNVWRPWNELSREISRHHWALAIIILINPINISEVEFKLNHLTKPVVKIIALIDEIIGQGLFSTKWYGWLEWVVI